MNDTAFSRIQPVINIVSTPPECYPLLILYDDAQTPIIVDHPTDIEIMRSYTIIDTNVKT